MLFNSFEFIAIFLPIAVLCFYVLSRFGYKFGIISLVLLSFFFYAYWKPEYLLLLLGSIAVNFLLAGIANQKKNKVILGITILGNLALLFYFKYAGFMVENYNGLSGHQLSVPDIILPIGISFFTFQQIAYQVDIYKGKVKSHNFWEYSLFVSFFPQLIAGPIVHHAEMISQFKGKTKKIFKIENIAVGLTIFTIGLFKKVVIADTLSAYVGPIFNDAFQGESVDFYASWVAALGYTFQLYFDFSGYSDMAIGAARLFGIRLPINFYSPYKSTNIIEFWRRWHMTLSRFFRDYLYIPLGGNRKGVARQFTNVFITMVLVGLWHGAGWTFIIWGAYHGGLILLAHAWRYLQRDRKRPAGLGALYAGFLLTFILVVVGWVFFRAESFEAAFIILGGMFGFNGLSVPVHLFHYGVLSSDSGIAVSVAGAKVTLYIILSMLVAFTMPNTMQIMKKFNPVFKYPDRFKDWSLLRSSWRPNILWAVFIFVLFLLSLGGMLSGETEFLYFNF